MSVASCTCTAHCGDCPGIQSGRTAPCTMYLEAQAETRRHRASVELLTASEAALQKFNRDGASDCAEAVALRIAIFNATGKEPS